MYFALRLYNSYYHAHASGQHMWPTHVATHVAHCDEGWKQLTLCLNFNEPKKNFWGV